MSAESGSAEVTTPEQAREEIHQLVQRFASNLDAYKRAEYKEAQVRVEFIDPFFEALGWDVRNVRGYAEQYKDVVHEDAIKVSGATRAPDYCFRVGGVRKFFLEAKKPAVPVKGDVGPAYQLRRYAWSAKLPLSILTDFEEFAVYDCRRRPKPTDKVSVGRVMYLTFDQYLDRFDDVYDVFAKESVLKGSFDRYVQDTKRKRGTSEVDVEFLKEIEGWRDTLARNIALRNAALTVHELNFAVQRTIDRIIFLRMCEDRGIEDYGCLLALTGGPQIYARLGELYRQADEKYDSELFDFQDDTLTRSLTLDDKALKPILAGLYYPQCPYEFSVLPAEILGQVYEQFLGKVIRLTPAHRAKVEEKPEVKKAGGVYYTPTYIVEYIVQQTVGKLVEGKTPRQSSKLRVLDPACGSGSFLLGAYQCLLDYHRQWYEAHDPAKHAKGKRPALYQGPGGEWRLTTGEKKRLLLNNIYGVDIDRQAVEVTKLSLLLKVLEGENQETLGQQLALWRERALPDLGDNIKCGNSLIGPDYFEGQLLPDEEEMRRVNPFEWEAEFPEIMARGGFDAVIGNPPYGTVTRPELKQFFGHCFEATEGRFDTYELFIERGFNLCGEAGLLGYIVPSPLLTNVYTRKLRRYLLDRSAIKEITNFAMDVFLDPTIHTCIIVVARGPTKQQLVRIRKQLTSIQGLERDYDYLVPQSSLGMSPNSTFDIFFDPSTLSILERLRTSAEPLGVLCYIRQCIKTGDNKRYLTTSPTRLSEPWKPSLTGKSIGRYATLQDDLFVKYGPWLARNWKNRSFYETPKILVRETGSRITATLDMKNHFVLSTLYSVYPTEQWKTLSLGYVLGLLNSKVGTYFMKMVALDLTKGAFTKVRANQLARLPIHTINFEDPDDVTRHDRMVALVELMLSLHKKLAAATIPADKELYQRQIDATDEEIDALVYELYGLTEKEIAIVEGRQE